MSETAQRGATGSAAIKFGLDDRPPALPLLLYGLQWWVVSIPCVIIVGFVVSRMHYPDYAAQIWYMRKLFALIGATLTVQLLFGHRLPLIIGPASILLVGITASQGASVDAVHTAILVGGLVMAAAGFSGVFARLRRFFTPRIIAVVLVLIAITLAPTILRLAVPASGDPWVSAFSPAFAVMLVFALTITNHLLPGMAKSMTVLFGLIAGSAVYFAATGFPELPAALPAGAAPAFFITFDFDAGTVLAFLFCFLALTINELSSVESIGQLLQADDMGGRLRRATGVTGLANAVAGGMGVLGPVDFSMSAGLLSATGCASRYTMLPAGIGLILCAVFPEFIMLLSTIPDPVMGALLLYLMATQMGSGFAMLGNGNGAAGFPGGITVGLPLMLGVLVAFAPASAFDAFPLLLRPIIGNGFVMGTIAVIALEHGVFRSA